MRQRERYMLVMERFRQAMPQVDTELRHDNNFQLLVAVILSAQCTDKRVNQVTPQLFSHYPDAFSMAKADYAHVLQLISSVSYPNSKARHLMDTAQMLVRDHDGEVPSDIDSLMMLPGVGRKTANVVQAVAFGRATMAVDTHVYRVSHRLALVASSDNTPLKVEKKLVRNIPEADIPRAHHWLLLHGRYVCTSRKPHCDRCFLSDVCPRLIDNSCLR